MKRLCIAALLVLPQLAFATAWTPTRSQDCTALGTPTSCCMVAAPAVNEVCLLRDTGAGMSRVYAQFKSDGGTYTVGGDPVSAANFARLGLGSVKFLDCQTGSTGRSFFPSVSLDGKTITFKAFSAFGTEMTAVAIPASEFVTCWVYGR